MSLIPTVGRRSWSSRLIIAGLYTLLSIGAVTMVYPFLVMLSSSIRSSADIDDYSVIPKYLHNNSVLFAKYADAKYGDNIPLINNYYGTDYVKAQDIQPPMVKALSQSQLTYVHDWRQFLYSCDLKYRIANFGPIPIQTAPSELLDKYRLWLRTRFHNDILALNKAYREDNLSFEQTVPPFERPTSREWQPDKSLKTQHWTEFERTLPQDGMSAAACEPLFYSYLKQNVYKGDISRLNAAYGSSYKSFTDVHLSATVPNQPARRADWESFVRTILPIRYLKVLPAAAIPYRAFLSKRYAGDISKLNAAYGTVYREFQQIGLPAETPSNPMQLLDWREFIEKSAPANTLQPVTVETLFRDFVIHKYGSLEAVSSAYSLHLDSIDSLSPPYYLTDWDYVLHHADSLRKQFVVRNYSMVFSYILFHGRAVTNTIIFCLAVILTHLIVNPLCAYALSRYNLQYSYKVLLFLLATMAFPAEVAMIPNFLLLKQLSLLNTYWALILPGMASGFSIFLLKGFFDSLPKELYEAGIIDGASETMMFRSITMPLSKPIFAVIALQAFTAAYGAFMFAFLVCQNPKMWTMMVWLYELQITAPKYITMAALTVAALPTLLVFIFCQNVIMRGIILPSYK